MHFRRDALTKIARIPKNPAGKRMKKRTHVNKLCSPKIPVFLSRLARLRFRFVRLIPSSVEPIFVKQSHWTVQFSSQLTPKNSRRCRCCYHCRCRHCCCRSCRCRILSCPYLTWKEEKRLTKLNKNWKERNDEIRVFDWSMATNYVISANGAKVTSSYD